MTENKIKAIVFDFDGTIVDTETAWYEAFREAYAEHGVELTLAQYSGCIGTSLHVFNPYTYLCTDHGIALDDVAFRARIRGRHAELMASEGIRPGIVAYLEAARAAGLRIGLATSSSSKWVEEHLEKWGLAHYFECVRTADHVEKVKPDPALYAQAAAGLGVAPNEAVAIEDSPNGARAALAAGLHCVVIPNGITKLLDFGDIPRHGESLEDIAFDELVRDPSFLLSKEPV